METRKLGTSDLDVTLVGLGCNNFGLRIDAEASRAVIYKALDLGITFFDTADVYGAAAARKRCWASSSAAAARTSCSRASSAIRWTKQAR